MSSFLGIGSGGGFCLVTETELGLRKNKEWLG